MTASRTTRLLGPRAAVAPHPVRDALRTARSQAFELGFVSGFAACFLAGPFVFWLFAYFMVVWGAEPLVAPLGVIAIAKSLVAGWIFLLIGQRTAFEGGLFLGIVAGAAAWGVLAALAAIAHGFVV